MPLRVAGKLAAILLVSVPAPAGSIPPTSVELKPYVGQLLTARVEIEGHPATLLFDTGGGQTLLSPALAGAIGCKPFGQIVAFRMSGERVVSKKCPGATLKIGRFTTRLEPGVLDINALLPPGLPPIDGVLALDAFADATIILDLDGRMLTVATGLPARAKRGSEGRLSLMRESGGLGLTAFAIAEAPAGRLRLLIDSGNLDKVFLSPGALDQLGMAGLPLGTEARASIKLTGLEAQQFDTRVADIIYDGALNAAMLKRYRVTLDLKRGRVWYAPRH